MSTVNNTEKTEAVKTVNKPNRQRKNRSKKVVTIDSKNQNKIITADEIKLVVTPTEEITTVEVKVKDTKKKSFWRWLMFWK